jgi:hypothetical protein
MTAQEIFDKVATHLLTQNKQAMNEDDQVCVYRTDGGLKCAVGVLIPDEDYLPLMEGQYLIGGEPHCPELHNFLEKAGLSAHIKLLHDLQHLHDSNNPDEWLTRLYKLASIYKFDTTVLAPFVNRSA